MRKARITYITAYTAIGAAIYYILLFLPGIPIIGAPEIKMEIGAALSPVFGVLLGPIPGFGAVLLGGILKFLTTPNIRSLPFIPAAPLSALVAGFLTERNWKIPAVLMIAMLVIAMFTPPFNPITEYWYVYLVAFYDKIIALALIPVTMWLLSRKNIVYYYYPLLYVLMFTSREADKAFGCTIFAFPQVYQGIFGIPDVAAVRYFYMISPLFYLVLYILEGLVAFAVLIPLIEATSRVPGFTETLHIKHLYRKE